MPNHARSAARAEAIGLLAVALLAIGLFASGALDIAAARAFYDPEPPDHWPLTHRLPWSLLYRAAPWATATLVVAGLAVAQVTEAVQHRAVLNEYQQQREQPGE